MSRSRTRKYRIWETAKQQERGGSRFPPPAAVGLTSCMHTGRHKCVIDGKGNPGGVTILVQSVYATHLPTY